MEAVEPKAKKSGDPKDDEADDLADAFGQLGVTRKCQVCMTELVIPCYTIDIADI
jgi:hypothetical protein